MSIQRIRPSRKASTATSLAALSHGRGGLAGPPGLVGEAEAGEGVEVGRLEVEAADGRPSRAGRTACRGDRARPGRTRWAAACPGWTAGRWWSRRCTRPSSGRSTAGGRPRRCGRSRADPCSRAPNSSWASITSRPLFIRVDESTVIFGPIFQVGWASASSTVTSASSARVRPRNGPPLAVSTRSATRAGPSGSRARRHWWMAQCSLSTGTSSAPGVRRTRWTTGPPAMSDSLLARARRRPACERGQRDGEAGEADHPVHAHVGLRADAGHALLADAQLAGRQLGLQPVEVGAVDDGDDLGSHGAGLGDELVDVAAARAERDDPEAVGLGGDDVEGLGADRAGGPRKGDRDGHEPTGVRACRRRAPRGSRTPAARRAGRRTGRARRRARGSACPCP